jgi:glycosyltransferase involved in cell wall biosynthesis
MTAHHLFVSTEDDRYLVKGGIGTYLGTLVRALGETYPERQIDWVTQSPTREDFIETHRNTRRHYLSRVTPGGTAMRLGVFAQSMGRYVDTLVASKVSLEPRCRVYVEAPEWEGLLASWYARCCQLNVLKVSRLHTPLSVCMSHNQLKRMSENLAQINRERCQISASDLLSAPTQYVLDNTMELALEPTDTQPPAAVLGNCVNSREFYPQRSSIPEALKKLQALTGVGLDLDTFRIFVLGSVEWRKGVQIVRNAIPGILARIPDAHICLLGRYGQGDDSASTANVKLSKQEFYAGIPERFHDRVQLAGFIPHNELPHILPAGDLYLFCYLADNFPGALAEVALCERPIVALLRGGVREMLNCKGEYLALTIDGTSENEISGQLVESVFKHRRDPLPGLALARALRRHLLCNFAEGVMLQRMLKLYDAALERKHLAHRRLVQSSTRLDHVVTKQCPPSHWSAS